MATYRKIAQEQSGENKVTILLKKDINDNIIGHVVASIIDEDGHGYQRGDEPMLELFDHLESFVGSGVVDVIDPDNLWDEDWPELT